MKTIIFLSIWIFAFSTGLTQTMTFDNGPSEPGFTFIGWDGTGGTIWLSNLIEPATLTKDNGTWNFTSFEVGPFVGENNMQVTSDLGQSYDYITDTAGIHTLNWAGVTSITFTRISGFGASADHDNFKYAPSGPCEDPDIPMLAYAPETVCNGDSAMLIISGNLNDATAWHVYTDSCAGTLIGTTTTTSFVVIPPTPGVTYFMRGEDGAGCVDESAGACSNVNVPVSAVDVSTSVSGVTITANATGANYQWIDCDFDITPIPGETNQTYTAQWTGNYAVIVSEGSCVDTSDCVNIIITSTNQISTFGINLYPNPSSGNFNIDLGQVYDEILVKIKNLNGQQISKHTYTHTNKIDLQFIGPAGIYFIELSTDEGKMAFLKIIKE